MSSSFILTILEPTNPPSPSTSPKVLIKDDIDIYGHHPNQLYMFFFDIFLIDDHIIIIFYDHIIILSPQCRF